MTQGKDEEIQFDYVPSGIGEGEGDEDPHKPGSPHHRPISMHPQFLRQTQASHEEVAQIS